MSSALSSQDQTELAKSFTELEASKFHYNPNKRALTRPQENLNIRPAPAQVILIANRRRFREQATTNVEGHEHRLSPAASLDQTTLFFPGDMWGELANLNAYCEVDGLDDLEQAEAAVEQAVRDLKW